MSGAESSEKYVLTRKQSRAIDDISIREFHMSSLVLMENAGRGVADSLLKRGVTQVAIACGRGNNGGDGFVIARHLSLRGVPVRVLWFPPSDQLSPDSAENYRILQRCNVEFYSADDCDDETLSCQWLANADWTVDSLLGTGTTGNLRLPIRRALRLMRDHPSRKLAVDIPSGLDCDTGFAEPAVCPADVTCSLVALKRGMLVDQGPAICGEIEVVGIGIPPFVLQQVLKQP
ncbi:MAG: NAD(P)H-hydrate epimerase [Planctomycetota bacterium]|nr:NAD(P)H-hydrate epimerase [Planctomycetota bacterium]MDA1177378.1 NAD(P)H-hydrate epimerase [Planctomycetota bacterium]